MRSFCPEDGSNFFEKLLPMYQSARGHIQEAHNIDSTVRSISLMSTIALGAASDRNVQVVTCLVAGAVRPQCLEDSAQCVRPCKRSKT
jgi:hypothetical protein